MSMDVIIPPGVCACGEPATHCDRIIDDFWLCSCDKHRPQKLPACWLCAGKGSVLATLDDGTGIPREYVCGICHGTGVDVGEFPRPICGTVT